MGTKAMPAVEDCGLSKPEVRPTTLTLACADANDLGVKLVWSKWAATGAYATGTYTWNTCVPYCAASKNWDKTPATFTLSDPVKTPGGLAVREAGGPHHREGPGQVMARTQVYQREAPGSGPGGRPPGRPKPSSAPLSRCGPGRCGAAV